MKKYFFDIDNGDGATKDHVGVDLASPGLIHREASQIILEIAKDEIPNLDNTHVAVTVREEDGSVLSILRLNFSTEKF